MDSKNIRGGRNLTSHWPSILIYAKMFPYASLLALALIPQARAIGTALGYGSATVGGGSATPATPSSTTELLEWLADDTQRVIEISEVYDFTDYYGTTTGTICKPWTCTPNPQLAIDANDWCEDYEPDAAKSTATYYNSGTSWEYSLKVGSQKTLLGKGDGAGIQGIGLLIEDADNVIIQNIKIFSINQEYVWGGDAIVIVGSTHVWIDHNYISNIGRQFIATGYDSAKDVTISNNVFDGRETYSALCNGDHYWAFIFTGEADTITFAQNYIYHTSGRGPHIGGTSGYTQYVHIVNNYYVDVDGFAVDPEVGAVTLVEGNYFNTVTTPTQPPTGYEYFIQTSSDASTCKSSLGRTCQTNTLLASGSVDSYVDSTVLSAFSSQSAITGYSPLTASAAATYVQANAGLGIVN